MSGQAKQTPTKKRVKARPAKTPPGAQALGQGQPPEGNRRAAIVLEVLAGIRTPTQAAEALKISVNYYYVMERKALAGLVEACQPQPKGPPGPTLEKQLAKLQAELVRCRQECQRQAALVRTLQRAAGLPSPDARPRVKKGSDGRAGSSAGKRKRKRRKASVRALQAVKALEKNSSLEKTAGDLKQSLQPAAHPEPSDSRLTQEGPAHVPAGKETAGGTTR